jgi:hypothetical protein
VERAVALLEPLVGLMCPHSACGMPMKDRGRLPRRHLAEGGAYVFCPHCGGIAQIFGTRAEFIYYDVPSVASCPDCGRAVPAPLPGRSARCIVCR